MKKRLLAAAVVATLTLPVGIALANPVELDGSASIQYRRDTLGDEKGDGTKQTFILNAKTKLAENLDLYARFAAQGNTNQNFKDYVKDADYVGEVDQFGLIYENAGFTYKLGRQDANIGATNLLYAGYSYVGKHEFVDGISISGKSGEIYFNLLASREDNEGPKHKLYSAHASYSPTEALTLGGTFAKFDAGKYDPNDDWFSTPSSKYWAVDAAYTNNKATYSGEFAKSDISGNNKAYDVGVTYAFDDRNSLYVSNFRVEQNGNIQGMTDFWSNEKGFFYSFDHQFSKDTSLNINYKDGKTLDNHEDSTSFKTTVTYKF